MFCSPYNTQDFLGFYPNPPLPLGPDKVPQVCELGPTPGGQASSGAVGKVEADGCGGLS